ncbi:AAA family ATPase [Anabaena cylindrica UHCC 0172]|nr:AAA family ATPase [Anabaena cylindrica]MEA5552074.1 AAA family ATPase [Anabaena cylindrica UHCC 0172]
MLKKLILENWKSFRYAELPLDPLTVLIGTNASGKSNVVEALEFLQRIANNEKIETALAGDKTLSPIRGGVEWAARKPENKFSLKASVQLEDGDSDYIYTIKVATEPFARILEDSILIQDYQNNNQHNPDSYYLSKLNYKYSLLQKKPISTRFEFLDEESGGLDN